MQDIDIADLKRISELIYQKHRYDFRNYAMSSFKRRVLRIMEIKRLTAETLLRKLHDQPSFINEFLDELTVNVTEMFRDVTFYKTLRESVLPVLATSPLIRIWHAGCSTGEEVYSMAIILHEANLLNKTLLYATNINPTVLETVRTGIFPLSQMKQYSENYILSGGKRDFSSYYIAQYNLAKFADFLSRKIVLSTHNLASDGSFNEFQLIMCRNVMIYFDKALQDKVLRLFYESLQPLGYLALGSKETLKFTELQQNFRQIENKEKIWRKII